MRRASLIGFILAVAITASTTVPLWFAAIIVVLLTLASVSVDLIRHGLELRK